MKIINININKKHKGTVDQFIIPLIGIFAIFVVCIATLNYINSTNKFIVANQICRKYILKIETYGYLDSDNVNKLENELSLQGFTNIDLSGTTLVPVSNGEDVYLNIKYDQTIKNIKIDGYNISLQNEVKRIYLTRSSTAKN